MRYLACVLLLLPGCTMDNPAFGRDTDSSGGSGSSATTTDTGSTAPDTKGTDTQSSDSGVTSDTTTDTTDSGTMSSTSGVDTVGTDGSTGAGSTGGPIACDPFTEEEWVEVAVLENGNPVELCDTQVVASGYTLVDGNQWSIYQCPGEPLSCDCVQGEETVFHFTVPAIWSWLTPAPLYCSRIIVNYDADCEFASALVQEVEGGVVHELPKWVGNNMGFQPQLPPLPFSFKPKINNPCDCEGDGCCAMQPGEYKYEVTNLTFDNSPWLYPGENKEAVDGIGNSYDIANAGSHVEPACGIPPHMAWVARYNPP